MNPLDTMKDAYDEVYVLDNTLMHEWYPARVTNAAAGTSLLELGLGHGHSSSRFAQHFPRYQVIEGSSEMIKRFRERFDIPGVDIVHAFFESFETEERFDCIGMGFILEHVDDPGLILRRFKKFLSPIGSIFVAVPNCESLHRRLGHAAGMLPDMTSLSDGDKRFGHQRYFSLKTLRQLVEDEGYEIIMSEGILLKPITTQQMLRLELSPAILQALLTVGIGYPELCNSILMQIRPRHSPA